MDEVVLIAAIVAAAGFGLVTLSRSRGIAGAVATAGRGSSSVVSRIVDDMFASFERSGRHFRLDWAIWAIWVVCGGLVAFALGSFAVFAETLAISVGASGRRRRLRVGDPRSWLRAVSRRRAIRTRSAFWAQARSVTPFVALEHRGDLFLLPTSIEPKLFAVEQRPEFVVLERACEALRRQGRLVGGETIVDVGAHIGTTTIPALSREGFARAVAVEPDPAHLRLLRANIALNRLDDRVTVIAAAASDWARPAQPFLQAGRKSPHRWMKGHLVSEPSSLTLPVDTLSLDDLVTAGVVEPDRVGLLWIGSEATQDLINGASLLLEQRVPIVLPVRRRDLVKGSALLARVAETYEVAVELREPRLTEPLASWGPAILPSTDFAGLVRRTSKVTDVLYV